jgi:hypothetical protein
MLDSLQSAMTLRIPPNHRKKIGSNPKPKRSFSRLLKSSKLSRKVIAVDGEEKEAVPISVVALRAESYSADGDSIVVSLRTKYSASERKYYVPIECFLDLIVDLRRLEASNSGKKTGKPVEKNEPLLPLDPLAAE